MIPPEYVQRSTETRTAVDRSQLFLLVLEGGQAFLVRARAALERGDFATFVADVSRTQQVLVELSQSFDDRRAGDIEAGVARLRERMVGQLALADAPRSLAHIDELLAAYATILDAYRDVVRPAAAT